MGALEGIRSQSEVCSPPQAPKKSDFDVPNLGILWDPGGGGVILSPGNIRLKIKKSWGLKPYAL